MRDAPQRRDCRSVDADRGGINVACGGVNVGKSGKAAGRLRAPPCGRFRRGDRLSWHWRSPKGVFRHAPFAERLRRDGLPEPPPRPLRGGAESLGGGSGWCMPGRIYIHGGTPPAALRGAENRRLRRRGRSRRTQGLLVWLIHGLSSRLLRLAYRSRNRVILYSHGSTVPALPNRSVRTSVATAKASSRAQSRPARNAGVVER